jgi:hypothetical protein
MSSSRKTLLWLAVISVLPIVASYALYFRGKHMSQMNHGELLPTRPAGLETLPVENTATHQAMADLVKNKWVYLTVQPAACDARCQRKLYLMRQIRTAQNDNMMRVERVWVIVGDGQPDARLLAEHPGLRLTRVANATQLTQLPLGADPGAYVFLLDPLGNLVLRYDDQSAPKGMLKDLGRLLRYSGLG